MVTKEEWELRRKQWHAFEQWQSNRAPDPHPPGDAIADIGAIYDWLPEHVRNSDEDPEKTGIQRMHSILALLPAR